MEEPTASPAAETPEPVATSSIDKPSKTAIAESPLRISLYVLAGVAAIYLATWSGGVFFYWSFQRPMFEARAEEQGTMLWAVPTKATAVPALGWESREGVKIRGSIPPGEIISSTPEGDGIRLKVGGGEVFVTEFREGFLREIWTHQLHELGGDPVPDLGDADILAEVMSQSPDDFRFGWNKQERSRHATRLLLKLILWEDREPTRMEIYDDKQGVVALADYPEGDTRILTASRAGGVRIIRIEPGSPEAWRHASPWLSEVPQDPVAGEITPK